MKLNQLGPIVDQIKKSICCPKCKRPFSEREIEVISICQNAIELHSNCSFCETRATILATIEPPKKVFRPLEQKAKSLSPETVHRLREQLKTLKVDVNQLFNKKEANS